MTKAVICYARDGALIYTPGVSKWQHCPCGESGARWLEPDAGTVVVAAADISKVRMLGLNNQLLLPAIQGETAMWQDFRALHDLATTAPDHVFDKSRAACWAVVFAVGQTSDVRWATPEEWRECFP